MSISGATFSVGGSRVVWSDTIYVPDGVDVEATITFAEGDDLSIVMRFLTEEPRSGQSESPQMRATTVDGIYQMDFVNFGSGSYANSMTRPLTIGQTDAGEAIMFFSTVERKKGFIKMGVQFSVGDMKLGGHDGAPQ